MPERVKVYITRKLPSIAKELLSEHFEVHENPENKPITREKLKHVVLGYDAILSTVSDKLDEDMLTKSKIKAISNYAVGLDNIDIEYAKKKGIAVYNTPDVVTESCADHAFAILFALIRKPHEAHEFISENKWKSWDPWIFNGEELNGKTLGIIGYGRIGKAIAKRAQGFGLKVIAHDKHWNPDPKLDVKRIELDYLFKHSDYISINLPLTKETTSFISKEEFEKMGKKPILINTARGPIVNTDALVHALEDGQIRGAALDVIDPEPLPGDHPICKFKNCIITPHIGTATQECRHNMAKIAAMNLINHFEEKE